MTILCIQCAMKAMLDGIEPPYFDETVEEHFRRVHFDPEATARERRRLEQRLRDKLFAGSGKSQSNGHSLP